MSKPSIERLRELIDQARKVHDEPTVKALGEKLFELTGVYEPEFAPVESSGDPKLDHLRKCLVMAIAARDEPTGVILREKIKEIEGEPLPEVTVELAEEECVEVVEEEIENPFAPPEVVAELEEELAPFVAEDYEQVDVEVLFGDALMATQLAALRKAGFGTESLLRGYIDQEPTNKASALILISGIGASSAKTILETLGYEA